MTSWGWLEHLWRVSWQGGVLIGLVWLVSRPRWGSRLPPGALALAWWLACGRMLVGLLWTAPPSLPILPAARSPEATATGGGAAGGRPMRLAMEAPASPAAAASASAGGEFDPGRLPARQAGRAPGTPARIRQAAGWLVGLWLLGAGFQMAAAARRYRSAMARGRLARPVADAHIARLVSDVGRALGLRRLPPLAEAPEGPLVFGARRPVLVLPPAAEFTAAELRLMVAHELAHLRRGDLWLGLLPGLAQALFFFHPLVRLAAREWATAAEAACDAEALRATGAAPGDYRRLLLRLAGRGDPSTATLPAGMARAAGSFDSLRRRLLMLSRSYPTASDSTALPGRFARRRLRAAAAGGLAAAAALLLLLPWQVTAQGEGTRDRGARAAERWEDVLLLDITRALKLSPGQIAAIVPLSQAADGRTARLRAAEERIYAALERLLQEHREGLLAGRGSQPVRENDAIRHRQELRQNRARAEDEIVRYVTPRLARILTPEQLLRAVMLSQGLLPEREGGTPALLDGEAGVVARSDAREAWRDAAVLQVLGRTYPPGVIERLDSSCPMVRYWNLEKEIADPRVGLDLWERNVTTVRLSRSLSVSMALPRAGDGATAESPAVDPAMQRAEKDRAALEEHPDRLIRQLLEGATPEQLEEALRPLVRRMFTSPRLTPVLTEIRGRAAPAGSD